jgi:hypothetical protein
VHASNWFALFFSILRVALATARQRVSSAWAIMHFSDAESTIAGQRLRAHISDG